MKNTIKYQWTYSVMIVILQILFLLPLLRRVRTSFYNFPTKSLQIHHNYVYPYSAPPLSIQTPSLRKNFAASCAKKYNEERRLRLPKFETRSLQNMPSPRKIRLPPVRQRQGVRESPKLGLSRQRLPQRVIWAVQMQLLRIHGQIQATLEASQPQETNQREVPTLW